jgi:hypothetical protein
MKCLDDAQVQALVDNEAVDDVRAHAASCAGCAARLEKRRTMIDAALLALNIPAPMPSTLRPRIEQAVVFSSPRGATRLRETGELPSRWRRAAWGGAAVAVATLVVVLFVVPMVKGPATVSAAEILAKSATRLAQTAGAGIELLEYELVLDGMPREMMPDRSNGTYRVSQVIDHDSPGHFRYSSFAPDGRLLTSIAQDPVTRQRVSLIRVDDQRYRFEFAVPAGNIPSLPEIERLHMQATVAMMQASGQQVLQTVDTAEGPLYRIQVPEVSAVKTSAMWDLSRAEVLIDARDFRVMEFSARGTFLEQPYSMSYRLISRAIVRTVQPDVFAVPAEPGEIVIAGDGTAIPATDVVFAALRELARAKGVR